MELITSLLDYVMHIDRYLTALVDAYGLLVYGIIALIIFCEVGVVVMPFLPGDSMLFAIGALCAAGAMDLRMVLILFPIAAIAGDNSNRLFGLWFGHKAFAGKDGRFFNQANLKKAQAFYAKFGPKAVTICRFMPFFRTFVPFVAGMAQMRWRIFFPYSVMGGAGWVFLCVFAGYFLGNIPFIKNNFELVILMVICISAVPAGIEYLKARREKKARLANDTET
ncbi:MAG TPA: VTT domain-containing protein [Fibrobacteraceae bacterium]|nr:VTT domain-containing protein [Fibrobacteraceae bacterium]